MTATALTLPITVVPQEVSPETQQAWVRRVLLMAFLVAGGLLTLFILSHLGPVAYGLPAPFFRRAAAADPQAT
jgi:hypothetical protein